MKQKFPLLIIILLLVGILYTLIGDRLWKTNTSVGNYVFRHIPPVTAFSGIIEKINNNALLLTNVILSSPTIMPAEDGKSDLQMTVRMTKKTEIRKVPRYVLPPFRLTDTEKQKIYPVFTGTVVPASELPPEGQVQVTTDTNLLTLNTNTVDAKTLSFSFMNGLDGAIVRTTPNTVTIRAMDQREYVFSISPETVVFWQDPLRTEFTSLEDLKTVKGDATLFMSDQEIIFGQTVPALYIRISKEVIPTGKPEQLVVPTVREE